MADNCVKCGTVVGRRQQAVSCDTCSRWQHRTCDTGITQQQYREAVRSEGNISFTCFMCTAQENQVGTTDLTESTPPFYSLITLLYQESEQVGETVRLVNGNQMIRRQRNSTTMEAKIFELWDNYGDGEMSATSLIKQVSLLYRTRVTRVEEVTDI